MILETQRLYLREMKQSNFDFIASQNVAVRNGMIFTDTWTKHYHGVDMPHYRYVVRNLQ